MAEGGDRRAEPVVGHETSSDSVSDASAALSDSPDSGMLMASEVLDELLTHARKLWSPGQSDWDRPPLRPAEPLGTSEPTDLNSLPLVAQALALTFTFPVSTADVQSHDKDQPADRAEPVDSTAAEQRQPVRPEYDDALEAESRRARPALLSQDALRDLHQRFERMKADALWQKDLTKDFKTLQNLETLQTYAESMRARFEPGTESYEQYDRVVKNAEKQRQELSRQLDDICEKRVKHAGEVFNQFLKDRKLPPTTLVLDGQRVDYHSLRTAAGHYMTGTGTISIARGSVASGGSLLELGATCLHEESHKWQDIDVVRSILERTGKDADARVINQEYRRLTCWGGELGVEFLQQARELHAGKPWTAEDEGRAKKFAEASRQYHSDFASEDRLYRESLAVEQSLDILKKDSSNGASELFRRLTQSRPGSLFKADRFGFEFQSRLFGGGAPMQRGNLNAEQKLEKDAIASGAKPNPVPEEIARLRDLYVATHDENGKLIPGKEHLWNERKAREALVNHLENRLKEIAPQLRQLETRYMHNLLERWSYQSEIMYYREHTGLRLETNPAELYLELKGKEPPLRFAASDPKPGEPGYVEVTATRVTREFLDANPHLKIDGQRPRTGDWLVTRGEGATSSRSVLSPAEMMAQFKPVAGKPGSFSEKGRVLELVSLPYGASLIVDGKPVSVQPGSMLGINSDGAATIISPEEIARFSSWRGADAKAMEHAIKLRQELERRSRERLIFERLNRALGAQSPPAPESAEKQPGELTLRPEPGFKPLESADGKIRVVGCLNGGQDAILFLKDVAHPSGSDVRYLPASFNPDRPEGYLELRFEHRPDGARYFMDKTSRQVFVYSQTDVPGLQPLKTMTPVANVEVLPRAQAELRLKPGSSPPTAVPSELARVNASQFAASGTIELLEVDPLSGRLKKVRAGAAGDVVRVGELNVETVDRLVKSWERELDKEIEKLRSDPARETELKELVRQRTALEAVKGELRAGGQRAAKVVEHFRRSTEPGAEVGKVPGNFRGRVAVGGGLVIGTGILVAALIGYYNRFLAQEPARPATGSYSLPSLGP